MMHRLGTFVPEVIGVILRIKDAREIAGYSQKELAERIGVAPNTFCGYEKGLHDPKSNLLVKIAETCGVSTDFLLGICENSKNANIVNVSDLSLEERKTIELMRTNSEALAQILLVMEMHKKDTPKE